MGGRKSKEQGKFLGTEARGKQLLFAKALF